MNKKYFTIGFLLILITLFLVLILNRKEHFYDTTTTPNTTTPNTTTPNTTTPNTTTPNTTTPNTTTPNTTTPNTTTPTTTPRYYNYNLSSYGAQSIGSDPDNKNWMLPVIIYPCSNSNNNNKNQKLIGKITFSDAQAKLINHLQPKFLPNSNEEHSVNGKNETVGCYKIKFFYDPMLGKDDSFLNKYFRFYENCPSPIKEDKEYNLYFSTKSQVTCIVTNCSDKKGRCSGYYSNTVENVKGGLKNQDPKTSTQNTCNWAINGKKSSCETKKKDTKYQTICASGSPDGSGGLNPLWPAEPLNPILPKTKIIDTTCKGSNTTTTRTPITTARATTTTKGPGGKTTKGPGGKTTKGPGGKTTKGPGGKTTKGPGGKTTKGPTTTSKGSGGTTHHPSNTTASPILGEMISDLILKLLS